MLRNVSGVRESSDYTDFWEAWLENWGRSDNDTNGFVCQTVPRQSAAFLFINMVSKKKLETRSIKLK